MTTDNSLCLRNPKWQHLIIIFLSSKHIKHIYTWWRSHVYIIHFSNCIATLSKSSLNKFDISDLSPLCFSALFLFLFLRSVSLSVSPLSLSALFLLLTPSPSSTHSLLIPKPFLVPNVTAIDGCLDLDLFPRGGFDPCTRRFPVGKYGPKIGIRCLTVWLNFWRPFRKVIHWRIRD